MQRYTIHGLNAFCSSTIFVGMGGDAPSKTLVCMYGAVLQKIGLECSGFSVSLQDILQSYSKQSYGKVTVLPLRF